MWAVPSFGEPLVGAHLARRLEARGELACKAGGHCPLEGKDGVAGGMDDQADRGHDDKHQVETKRHSCQDDHRGWNLHCVVQGATGGREGRFDPGMVSLPMFALAGVPLAPGPLAAGLLSVGFLAGCGGAGGYRGSNFPDPIGVTLDSEFGGPPPTA